MKKLIISIVLMALIGCSPEQDLANKMNTEQQFRLDLFHNGKIIKSVKKTQILVWHDFIQFRDDEGTISYWKGEYFAQKIK